MPFRISRHLIYYFFIRAELDDLDRSAGILHVPCVHKDSQYEYGYIYPLLLSVSHMTLLVTGEVLCRSDGIIIRRRRAETAEFKPAERWQGQDARAYTHIS
jgi:hypothetical protein